ncbi:MAG: DUF86 domain-containing protein [Methanocorpusculum sp.]|nr:DUF86 domain-containing protein [Methanocorpusculum sp.]
MSCTDEQLAAHIVEHCRRILNITKDTTYEAFCGNVTNQDAVIRNIEVIGEAAGNLSEEFAAAHPEIPILILRGMRNFLAHQYFRADIDVIWQTCREDIPGLYEQFLRVTGKKLP